jgi:hypothetical protein
MKTNRTHRCWDHLSNPANIANFDGPKNDMNSTYHFFHRYERAAEEGYPRRPLAAREAYDGYQASLRASAENNLISSGAG